ncbi:MAG TPA: histidine kinase dimerization/phosphoacceptor domain -containing protein [Rubrobacter sp.]|nr:histidine kinase dimerization/phosphoacceptor domain -containing protein [Rubrobacter sp.]
MQRLIPHSFRTRAWPWWVRYAAATLLVVAALAVRLQIQGNLPGYPFILFFPVIVAVSFLFDSGTGFWATILSAVLSAYFLLEPVGSIEVREPGDAMALVLFVVIGLGTASVIEALHTALLEVIRSREELAVAHGRLETSEHDKDTILREMVHRTKNDLQMLNAMFHFQERGTSDPFAKEVLRTAANRVHVMGRVHERLTRHGLEAIADTSEFITSLCDDLRASLVGIRPIKVEVEAESHPLPVDRAVPVGLIINELLTNALKHAFPEERSGTVRVRFFRTGDDFCLVVADDGVGMEKARTEGTKLGQRLIRSLATQLGGRLELRSSPAGTTAEVHFPATDPSGGTLAGVADITQTRSPEQRDRRACNKDGIAGQTVSPPPVCPAARLPRRGGPPFAMAAVQPASFSREGLNPSVCAGLEVLGGPRQGGFDLPFGVGLRHKPKGFGRLRLLSHARRREVGRQKDAGQVEPPPEFERRLDPVPAAPQIDVHQHEIRSAGFGGRYGPCMGSRSADDHIAKVLNHVFQPHRHDDFVLHDQNAQPKRGARALVAADGLCGTENPVRARSVSNPGANQSDWHDEHGPPLSDLQILPPCGSRWRGSIGDTLRQIKCGVALCKPETPVLTWIKAGP